ncbi:HEAT repeat domain-containing protein [Dyella mobilis]|uniref:HEAT repeat domain-containing protein n=1 Tax=Dyella mobilis TaxID=1849582 RepID=A0ABS2KDD6_9GAMM|nr:HEAT repeat domain-containing protein [Dyella mobilis]MBM7128787.1 HEAT repeat domain-containing protein [Dyella mobilis]GLQ99118.1 hypothetical protein GCM10007863_35380 [Dyella mobilis]
MTTELPKEEVAQRRIRSAESVVKLVDEMGVLCRQGIDDHAIDLIVDNLKDDDDTVRSLIAISLGNIGAKSYRVIPALKIALKMAGPPNNGAPLNVGTLKLSLGPDLGSSSSIPVSIKKIMEAHKLEYGIGDTH